MHTKNVQDNLPPHFFVVDGDGWVLDTFDFSYIPSETDEVYPETCSAQCTHVWRALNPNRKNIWLWWNKIICKRSLL